MKGLNIHNMKYRIQHFEPIFGKIHRFRLWSNQLWLPIWYLIQQHWNVFCQRVQHKD